MSREVKNFWIFVGPAVVIILGLIIFPMVFSLNVSFRNYLLNAPLLPKSFNFFKNYQKIILDAISIKALINTLTLVVCATGIEFIIGLLLAYLLSKVHKVSRIMTIFLMVPMMAAPVMVGVIWHMMYNPIFGFLNLFLDLLGSKSTIEWLTEPRVALLSIIIADVWEWTPFVFLILYAGFLSLPNEPREAALVDGASEIKIFFKIILPLLKPIVLVAVLIRVIDCFKLFDLIFILTKGGPGARTETLSMYIYHNAFKYFDLGYAAALSFFLLIIVLIPTTVFLRMMTRGAKEYGI
jgi:multiple sugar transport system permease protein